MTVLVSDVLRPAKPTAPLVRYWDALDIDQVAAAVCEQLALPGVVLDLTRIDGRRVFPVICVDSEAVTYRRSLGTGPILNRALLRDFADESAHVPPPPSAISIQAFISVDPFPRARRSLAGLAAWARAVAALPIGCGLGEVDATACDFYGYTVATADTETAEVLVGGHSGPAPRMVAARDAWMMLREEQLFDLAITCGMIAWD